ncbi:sigma-70 family RNA polymerase sigma factor [candidate division NPL-UPA2 bacterium]|nr:sigma-70 family RNA polymerase sigma factor [candidate division NPL-UPA2 bacterium]
MSSEWDEEKKGQDKDAISLYLKEVRKVPLLTAEEELELARKGKRSQEARRKLIRANLRLVINIARRYLQLGLPLLDLVEEGNLGLMKAAEKYEYKKGCRFSTYASWWIRQFITRALANQGKTIRIPPHVVEMVSKWRKVNRQLTQKLGRGPTVSEVAKEMKLTPARVRRIKELARKPGYLDAPPDEGGMGQLLDLIEDKDIPSPAKEVADLIERERLIFLLDSLSPREREVIRLRFGLGDDITRTLEETGKELGVTRERIRQLESSATKKLRRLLLEEDREYLR